MKTKLSIMLLSLFAVAFIACGSAEKVAQGKSPEQLKKEAEAEAASVRKRAENSTKVTAMNKRLEKVQLAGFPTWGAKVDTSKYNKWAKLAAPVINTIAKDVPEGYKFQITGHATSNGDEDRNQQISNTRAKFVYDRLKANGLNNDKVTHKGVSYNQPKPGTDASSSKNRRVSFQIVEE